MTNILDLIDGNLLQQEVAAGYIRTQQHPYLPYVIYNYTEKAQFDRHWTDATMLCRGLIVDDDGEVIARPFPKFFNHDQPEADGPREGAVTVLDKLDGSLGILYPTPNGWRVATRGSFLSEQARHANTVYMERYGDLAPPAGWTLLFEIVYPDNRIVVDYGDMDDLVLLGAVNIKTGRIVNPASVVGWSGPTAQTFRYGSYAGALAAAPRPNAEGIVVRFHRTNTLVKIKQDDYVALHRIVTGWNERTVWQHLRNGGKIAELADNLPDEFHVWATEVSQALCYTKALAVADVTTKFWSIVNELPGGWYRKEFAIEASKSPSRAGLFLMLDGNDDGLDAWAWDQVKPSTKKEAQLV